MGLRGEGAVARPALVKHGALDVVRLCPDKHSLVSSTLATNCCGWRNAWHRVAGTVYAYLLCTILSRLNYTRYGYKCGFPTVNVHAYDR